MCDNVHVMRFETLAEDWKSYANENGIDPSLPHYNRTNDIDYDDERFVLTDEDREYVRKIYRVDFDAFGYDRG